MESSFLLISIVLVAGVWFARMNNRLGLPVLVGFVGMGVLLGPGGFGIVSPISPLVAQYIGYTALVLILFDGGLHTSLVKIQRAWVPALSLATFGVVLSSAVMAVAAHDLLRIPWASSAMFGVAVSSTDAASVFSILGGQPLRRKLVDILEVESGANDPMAFFLMSALIEWSRLGHASHFGIWPVLAQFLGEMVLGLVVGGAVGWLGSIVNRNIKLDTGGLYPTLSLSFALMSFSVAQLLHGSGFLSVYVASVVMSNRKMEHRYSIMRFHEGVAWTMHIFMFVVLGFLLIPKELGPVLIPGLLLAGVALVFARPISVWLSTMFTGLTGSDKLFLSWAGLRGAAPVVLILSAVVSHVAQSEGLLDAVFFVVIASTVVQSLSVTSLARTLNLVDLAPSESLWELVSIMRENAIVLPIEIGADSRFVGRRMVDIAFPPNTLCYAVIRQERVLVPRGTTRLQASDHLLVLSDRAQIPSLRHVFRHEAVGNPDVLR